MTTLIVLFHILACLTLIIVVLIQGGNESGLSGTLGGGGSDSVFGAKSSSFMTKFTSIMAVVFMLSSMSLSLFASKRSKSVVLESVEDKRPVAAAPIKPAQENKTVGTTETTTNAAAATTTTAATEATKTESQVVTATASKQEEKPVVTSEKTEAENPKQK
jgi:preprotein translocase subunit SecG